MRRSSSSGLLCCFHLLYLLVILSLRDCLGQSDNGGTNITNITPTREEVMNILSTDVPEEAVMDEDVIDMATFEWSKVQNATASPSTSFVVCASHGREGVEQITRHLVPAQQLPLYSKENLTCFIFYTTASEIKTIATTVPELTYATPLPSVFKAAKGLFRRAITGYMLADTHMCEAGLRLVLAPGLGRYKYNLNAAMSRIKADLATGAFKEVVAHNFYWVANTTIHLPDALNSDEQKSRQQGRHHLRAGRRRRRWSDGSYPREGTGTTIYTTLPPRGQKWNDKIVAVLSGNVTCDYSGLSFQADIPYISAKGLCSLNTAVDLRTSTSCLVTLLAYLTTQSEIMYIEPYPRVQLFNGPAAGIMQSGDPTNFPLWRAGLDGSGQIVQVADTGLDVNHCFFADRSGNVPPTTFSAGAFDLSKRKVVQYVSWTDSTDYQAGHGTHVSGTVAGYQAGTSFGSAYNGVAPMAKIAFYDIGNSNGALDLPANLLTKMFPPAYLAGARVFSYSWGTMSNQYTYLDVQMDQYMYEHSDALILVAAGNSGNLGAKSVFSPALTKNGLAVGASNSINSPYPNITNLAWFSSQGPTLDGRIKPDLLGVGYRVTSASAKSGCGTLSLSGTSMATPGIAGLALLVRQYFVEGWYPTGSKNLANAFNPSGALVKAVLINSAVRVYQYVSSRGVVTKLGSGPDSIQGFGRAQLDRVLRIGGRPSLFVSDVNALATTGLHSFTFTIPKSRISAFEVTLTWTDPDTTATAKQQVIHDLDLYVTSDVSGTTFYANGLSTFDKVNNVEKVRVANPTPGDVLTVYVRGTSVTTALVQRYALVASGSFVSGAWYCQDPFMPFLWTTANCLLSCPAPLTKSPICCNADAGDLCFPLIESVSSCDITQKPKDCDLQPGATTTTSSSVTSTSSTRSPTKGPTSRPVSLAPTRASAAPTKAPTTTQSSLSTTKTPTRVPTASPTARLPTGVPSRAPTAPTKVPTAQPSRQLTLRPATAAPTRVPTGMPKGTTRAPSLLPTPAPVTLRPTGIPTRAPTAPNRLPTTGPTRVPTGVPTRVPTGVPTRVPTGVPTKVPGTKVPSTSPTRFPTPPPSTNSPSRTPTSLPTNKLPSKNPTAVPSTTSSSAQPTRVPSSPPTSQSPTRTPTSPTRRPTLAPSA